MKDTLPYRREAFRLWFEYLRVARNSTRTDVREALRRSATFYTPWGDMTKTKFDAWWKDRRYLFEDKSTVRQLKAGEAPSHPNALVIEVPLTQSPTELIKRVGEIIRAAAVARSEDSRTKSKKRPTSQYRLSTGAEPKLRAVREMLTVYRDVYLKDHSIRGEDLLEKVHIFYRGRRIKKWAKVPMPLLPDPDGDRIRAMRNLRRYITKAERIVLNVAKGEFPGRY